jgi:hypothetical protein
MPASGQITIRTNPDLVLRVKEAAAADGKSMNEYVEHLIEVAVDPSRATTEDERLVARLRAAGLYEPPEVAVDPSRATTEDERLVARLRAAGLYEPPGEPVERPDPALLAEARKRARRGRPASEYVSLDRDE